MRLLLISPVNPLSRFYKVNWSPWNRYNVFRPLGLLVLAGLTPPEWEVTVIDECHSVPDYTKLPPYDLVGITAFSSQASRAYEIAANFRKKGTPVVMGGIHATMCLEEASQQVDAVVVGEGESVWLQVLEDTKRLNLAKVYRATRPSMSCIPAARHDLLPHGYHMGSIQITRGCPLNCNYCSVTAFNGGRFRRRPIANVLKELSLIREKSLLIVDDNLIGISDEDILFCKDLFRAMIKAGIRKRWVTHATINLADDDELLRLASQAGCVGVSIAFDALSREGLLELDKRYYARPDRDFQASVRRIRQQGILVAGGFILGLDVQSPGLGTDIALTATHYGVDILNVTLLTPLPGTRLWEKMQSEQRLICNQFPEDWQYYTLKFPVAKFKNFSWPEILAEMKTANRAFYSFTPLLQRVFRNVLENRHPLINLGVNLTCRQVGLSQDRWIYSNLKSSRYAAEFGRPNPGL